MQKPIEVLKEYIRFPSVSTDPAYAEGMLGARRFATGLLEQLGFASRSRRDGAASNSAGRSHW